MQLKNDFGKNPIVGFDLLKKLTDEVAEYAKVEIAPKSEGKQIMMILVPQLENK